MWNAFQYVVGVGCEMFDLRLHAVSMGLEGYEVVLTDVLGRRPEFTRFVHRQLSIMIQRFLGVKLPAVWEPNRAPEEDVLVDVDEAIKAIALIHAGPVEAGLVRSTSNMRNGVMTSPGEVLSATKPEGFFHDAKFPEHVSLTLTRPFETALRDREYSQELDRRCRDEEARARASARDRGQKIIGWRRLVTGRHRRKRRSEKSALHRFRVVLRIARRETLMRWQKAYRGALRAFNDGDRESQFPAGTYWMVKFHGCRC